MIMLVPDEEILSNVNVIESSVISPDGFKNFLFCFFVCWFIFIFIFKFLDLMSKYSFREGSIFFWMESQLTNAIY